MEATLTPYGPGAIVFYRPKLRLSNDAYWRVGGISQHYVMVVTARRAFNDNALLVMPITSQVDRYYGYRIWLKDKWAVIEPDRMHTLDMSLIEEYVGVVPRTVYDKCLKAHAWILGLVDEIPECYASIPDVYAFATAGSVNIPKHPLKFGAARFNSVDAVAWNCYHAMGLGPNDVPLPTVETVEAEGPLAPENFAPKTIELPAPIQEPAPVVQEAPKQLPVAIAGGKKDTPVVIEVPARPNVDNLKAPIPPEIQKALYEMNYPEPHTRPECPEAKRIEEMETIKGTTVGEALKDEEEAAPRRGKKAAKAKKAARAIAEAERKAKEAEEAKRKAEEEKAAKEAALAAEKARLAEEAKKRKAAKEAEERLKAEAAAWDKSLTDVGLELVKNLGAFRNDRNYGVPKVENVVREIARANTNAMALKGIMNGLREIGIFHPYTVDRLKRDCYVASGVTKGDPVAWDDLRGDYRTRLSQLFAARMPKNGEPWGFGNQLSSKELGDVLMGLVNEDTHEVAVSNVHIEHQRYAMDNAEKILSVLIDPKSRSKDTFHVVGKRKSTRQSYKLMITNPDNLGKLSATDMQALEDLADKYNVRYAAIATLYYDIWSCQRVITKLNAMYTYRTASAYLEAFYNELMLGYQESMMVRVYKAMHKPQLKTIRKWFSENVGRPDDSIRSVTIEDVFTIMCGQYGWDVREFGDGKQMYGAFIAAYDIIDDCTETWPWNRKFYFKEGTPLYYRYNHTYSNVGKKYRQGIESIPTGDDFAKEFANPAYLADILLAFYDTLSPDTKRDIYLGYQHAANFFDAYAMNADLNQEQHDAACVVANRFVMGVIRHNSIMMVEERCGDMSGSDVVDYMVGVPKDDGSDTLIAMNNFIMCCLHPTDLMVMEVSLKDYKAACEMRGFNYATQTYCGIIEYNDLVAENEKSWFKG